jgi:hypothetical protein
MSRSVAQITIAVFDKGKGGVQEKRYLDQYVTAQTKKDIRDDRQNLSKLESKEKPWN